MMLIAGHRTHFLGKPFEKCEEGWSHTYSACICAPRNKHSVAEQLLIPAWYQGNFWDSESCRTLELRRPHDTMTDR